MLIILRSPCMANGTLRSSGCSDRLTGLLHHIEKGTYMLAVIFVADAKPLCAHARASPMQNPCGNPQGPALHAEARTGLRGCTWSATEGWAAVVRWARTHFSCSYTHEVM